MLGIQISRGCRNMSSTPSHNCWFYIKIIVKQILIIIKQIQTNDEQNIFKIIFQNIVGKGADEMYARKKEL